MAQSKSFFGLRRGSTKTLTFSVYNGKQVTKDRVADVKNPRSSAQMKQRAIMATALHGYSALKEICDHSFEGVTYGQKSMNYFVAENARMIRSAAPKVNLSLFKGNSVSNAYIISKGSLPSIEVKSVVTDGSIRQFQIPMANGDSVTFGKVMSSLGATLAGDMVTFVFLKDNPGGNASIYWVRLKLSDENKGKTMAQGDNILENMTEGTDFETNIDNFTPNDLSLLTMETYLAPEITGSSQVPQSLGVIMSRKADAAWLRSSSTMVNLFDTFNYTEALATYPENGERILNGGNM